MRWNQSKSSAAAYLFAVIASVSLSTHAQLGAHNHLAPTLTGSRACARLEFSLSIWAFASVSFLSKFSVDSPLMIELEDGRGSQDGKKELAPGVNSDETAITMLPEGSSSSSRAHPLTMRELIFKTLEDPGFSKTVCIRLRICYVFAWRRPIELPVVCSWERYHAPMAARVSLLTPIGRA